jgi:hypothetical protein
LVPDQVKSRFLWPTIDERDQWLAVRDSTPIAVPDLREQLGAGWDFFRVFESIEECEYNLLACEAVGEGIAEMRINPQAYPYGGVGALIALIEGFGFTVDGVNECGRYESRDELLGDRPDGSSEGTGRGSWLRRVLGLFGARRSEG